MKSLQISNYVNSALKALPSRTPELDRLLLLRQERHFEEEENVVITAQENVVITPVVVICYTCGGRDFWQGSGAVVCRRCHPPAPGAEVGGAA